MLDYHFYELKNFNDEWYMAKFEKLNVQLPERFCTILICERDVEFFSWSFTAGVLSQEDYGTLARLWKRYLIYDRKFRPSEILELK